MPAPTVTKAAIQRAIEATQAAGLIPSAVTVCKDGTIRIETAKAKPVDTAKETGQVLGPKKWSVG